MTDPDAAPHGGESLTAFAARVAAWLDDAGAPRRPRGRDHARRRRQGGGRARARRAARGVLADRLRAAVRSPSCTPTTAAGPSRASTMPNVSAIRHVAALRRGALMSGAALVGGYAADALLRRSAALASRRGLRERRAGASSARPTRRPGCAGRCYAAGLVGSRPARRRAAARAPRAPAGRGVALAAITWAALGGRSLAGEARRARATCSRPATSTARAATLPVAVRARPRGPRRGAAVPRGASSRSRRTPSDAVVGALVWGAVAGPGGRRRLPRRQHARRDGRPPQRALRAFGWAAARLDDALNWPAARAGAALAALCAPRRRRLARARRWRTLRRDGARAPEPERGPRWRRRSPARSACGSAAR